MAAIRRADGRVDYRTRDVEKIYPNVYARKGTVPGIYFQEAQNLDTLFQDAIEADAANNMRSPILASPILRPTRSPGTPVTPVPDPVLAAIIQRLNEDDESYDSYSSNDVTMEDASDFSQQREANARAVAMMEAARARIEAARAAQAARNPTIPDFDIRVVNDAVALEDAERALADAERALFLDDSDVDGLFGAGINEELLRAGVKRGDPWQNRTRKRSRDPNWVVSESKRPRDTTWDASYLGNRLIQAVGFGQAEVVRQLLAAPGIDVNTVNDKGYTALMVAAETGFTEAVRQLLAAPGIDVNTVNDKGYTALMYATEEGWDEVVMQLLAAPDINMYLENADVKTAWDLAIEGGHDAIDQLLLRRVRQIQQPI